MRPYGFGRRRQDYTTEPKEFEEKVVQVNRVSKKTQGGNRFGFSVVVVVGDKKGRVGVGLGKAGDVQSSIQKGATYAKKHLITVPMVDSTIPHEVYVKVGAAKVLLKPASPGTGVIAGGSVRAVVEAAGIKDILSKVLGTSNQASNVYATLEALRQLRPIKAREVVEKKRAENPKVSRPSKKEVKKSPSKAKTKKRGER
jgi:small subunit ribosomal protein S5